MNTTRRILCTMCATLLLAGCSTSAENEGEEPATTIDLMSGQAVEPYEGPQENLSAGTYDEGRVVVYSLDDPIEELREQHDEAAEGAAIQDQAVKSSVKVYKVR